MNEDYYFWHPYFEIDLRTPRKLMVKVTLNTDIDYSDLKEAVRDTLISKYLNNIVQSANMHDIVSYVLQEVTGYIKKRNIEIKDQNDYIQSTDWLDMVSTDEIVYDSHLLDAEAESVLQNDDRTFNEKLYWNLLTSNDISDRHDTKFIANFLSRKYKHFDCIDNYRICYSNQDRVMAANYVFQRDRGCCGEFDKHLYNPVTDHYFWVGFNYGH